MPRPVSSRTLRHYIAIFKTIHRTLWKIAARFGSDSSASHKHFQNTKLTRKLNPLEYTVLAAKASQNSLT